MYSGLSGLNANALELSLIGNNLANINTPGYKSSSGGFQDLLSQTLTGGSSEGNINFLQVGLGAEIATTNQNFAQGSLQSTGINTNVAIQGGGFFVVDGAEGVNYTRAGDFHIDAKGNLVAPDGAFVQGYTQKDPATGKVIPSGTLNNIVMPPGALFPPVPTSEAKMIANLNADAANGDTFTSSIRMFDSLGSAHQVNFTWTKTGVGAYNYDVTIDGGEVTGGTAGTQFSLLSAPGTMKFDTSGILTDVDSTPAADKSITTPTFTNGASALTFNWDLVDANGTANLMNVSAPSATSSSSQNGLSAGTLTSIAIGVDGTVQGFFSSGHTAEIARLALATFNNPGGLLKLGGNRFNVSVSSGEPSVGAAGNGGRGTIAGGTLELSNVDMAAEFISMIVAQRGYQANSRIITTTDQLLQESINLKQ
jgi:flagellar hook protein FlgE